MTRRRYAQLTLSQLVLYGVVLPGPESLMDPQLRRIDKLLDDEALVDEVLRILRRRRPQSERRGRPGTPAEVVLRLLALKHLRRWSYDQLEWEVKGNLVYRRFCRIDGGKVPDAKTMVRLGQLLDEKTLRALFERVVAMAVDEGTTAGRKMRVDTTVVETPIHYPTDSSLCQDVVRVLGRSLRRLALAGLALPVRLRNVARSVSRRAREIAQLLRLRGDAAKEAIKKPYRGLLRVTARLVRHARLVVGSVRPQLRRLDDKSRSAARRTLAYLEQMLPRAQRVVQQTRARILRGVTNWPGKILSLFQPDAQILRRGKLHKPTEFGRLVKVQESEGGLVSDIAVVDGHNDCELLVPSVKQHIQRFARAPRLAATDRGFFSTEGERKIQRLGVHRAVIPRPGKRSKQRIAHERQRWFRRGRAWRAGGEARINRLKHHFGMARSRYRGASGIERTIFWAAIANNLVAIAA